MLLSCVDLLKILYANKNRNIYFITFDEFMVKYYNKGFDDEEKFLENFWIKFYKPESSNMNNKSWLLSLNLNKSPLSQQDVSEMYDLFLNKFIGEPPNRIDEIYNLFKCKICTNIYYYSNKNKVTEEPVIRTTINEQIYCPLYSLASNVNDFKTLWKLNFTTEVIDNSERIKTVQSLDNISAGVKPSNEIGKYPHRKLQFLSDTSKYFVININRISFANSSKFSHNINNIPKYPIFYLDIYDQINTGSKNAFQKSILKSTYSRTIKKYYKLISFSVHNGTSYKAGHWIAYRLFGDNWFEFNDLPKNNPVLDVTNKIDNILKQASLLMYELVEERQLENGDEEYLKLHTYSEWNPQSSSPNPSVNTPLVNISKWKIGDTKHDNILEAVKEYYSSISPSSRPSNGSWNISSLTGINTSNITEINIADLINKHVFILNSFEDEIILHSPNTNAPKCTVCNSVFILRNANGTFSIMKPNEGYKFKNSANINKNNIKLNSLIDK
jgi:hypothetical protein